MMSRPPVSPRKEKADVAGTLDPIGGESPARRSSAKSSLDNHSAHTKRRTKSFTSHRSKSTSELDFHELDTITALANQLMTGVSGKKSFPSVGNFKDAMDIPDFENFADNSDKPASADNNNNKTTVPREPSYNMPDKAPSDANMGSALKKDVFRVGIVISDIENKVTDESSVAAIANPVSKCQVVSLTVLNLKNRPECEIRKAAKAWIRRNYVKGLRRHQQYLEYQQHQDYKRYHNVQYQLQYHQNQLLTQNESEESDSDNDELVEREENSDEVIVDKHSNVEILIGEKGFQKLLSKSRRDCGAQETPSSSTFVDGVYLIISESRNQLHYASEVLKAEKHLLLNDPVSTSLLHFLQQLDLAKKYKRFVQFSTMFVHQYRVKTFLECVTSSETFGSIESVDVILNLNYNDLSEVGVKLPISGVGENKEKGEPALYHEQGCIHKLGRFCVLITTLILGRAVNNTFEEEESRPLTAQVKSFTTALSASDIATQAAVDNNIPLSAKCTVHFTNNRVLTFDVSYSAAPTRQVLTVRAKDRYATMTDFVIPHPDGLATCRLYDKAHTTLPSGEGEVDDGQVDVVCGEAVDMPSGPPQDVIMWRRFGELSRAIEQEGWYGNGNSNQNSDASNTEELLECNKNNQRLGLDIDGSSHHNSTHVSNPYYKIHTGGITTAAEEVQEAINITGVSIQTKCILMALTKSCNTSADDRNKKTRTGQKVVVELPQYM